MLSIYFGANPIAVREAVFAAVGALEAEGVRVHRLEADAYEPGVIADALGAASLFGERECYVLDTPSAQAEFAEAVKESAADMAESANQFVIIEGKLLAPEKKRYQKHAAVFEEFAASGSEERFNVFALSDALARRDKKSLWLLYTQAKQNGLSEEEIIGTLWWQLKSMRLARASSSAAEAGMKEFPYKKAKQALAKYKDEELDARAHSLLLVYHNGHAGRRDIALALEDWVLTL